MKSENKIVKFDLIRESRIQTSVSAAFEAINLIDWKVFFMVLLWRLLINHDIGRNAKGNRFMLSLLLPLQLMKGWKDVVAAVAALSANDRYLKKFCSICLWSWRSQTGDLPSSQLFLVFLLKPYIKYL